MKTKYKKKKIKVVSAGFLSWDFTKTCCQKMARAFGGCRTCYGKGYASVATKGIISMRFCTCGRGKQLMKLWHEAEEILLNTALKPMGVSRWKEHGKKYGYWDFFEKKRKRNEIS